MLERGFLQVLILGFLASPLPAQTLRGRIVLPDSLTPVANATVVVRNDSGTVVGRVASGEDGRYSMRLPRPGRYELQSIRIGFSPVRLSLDNLMRGEDRAVVVVMTEQPLQLAAIDVQGDDRCRMSRNEQDRFVQLWQQARAALPATSSARNGDFEARVLLVGGTEDGPVSLPPDRSFLVWNPNDRHPEADSSQAREVFLAQPLGSTPAATLFDSGYVRRSGSGEVTYDVPNPNVLLSERFLASYCFGVEGSPRGHDEWIGLSFRPIEGVDSLTDIDGTLWVDKATSQIRRVDYSYRNLPRTPFESCVSRNRPVGLRPGESRFGPYCREPFGGGWRPAPPEGTGGTVEYLFLGPTEWFASRWTIRTPGKEFVDRYAGFNVKTDNGRRVLCNDRPSACRRVYVGVPRLLVSSGSVAVLMRDGEKRYEDQPTIEAMARIAAKQAGRSPAHIIGTLTDEEGHPVAGALVTTESPARATMSDSLGRFEIRTLPAREMALEVAHAGRGKQIVRVSLKPNTTEHLSITVAQPLAPP